MSARFQIDSTPIAGVMVLKRTVMRDDRGSLERLFCARELANAGWTFPITDINWTHTRHKGTVRGLHYQHPPYAEDKLIQCLSGSVWDVAVDLREDSPSFLQWFAIRLSAEADNAVLLPKGVAHGFQALSDDARVLYFCSHPYSPHAEGGLHPQDTRLNINWPLPVTHVSEKDAAWPALTDAFAGVRLR